MNMLATIILLHMPYLILGQFGGIRNLIVDDGSVRSSSFDLAWSRIQEASKYRLQIYPLYNPIKVAISTTTSANSYQATGLQPNTLYTVQVDAMGGDEVLPYRTAITARTVPNGIQITNHVSTPHIISVFLEELPGVTQWTIKIREIGTSSDTTTSVPDPTVDTLNFSYIARITGLKSNTNYELHARASQMFGHKNLTEPISPYGRAFQIKTEPASAFANSVLKRDYFANIHQNMTTRKQIEEQLTAFYQRTASTFLSVTLLELENANGKVCCHHEIMLEDRVVGDPDLSLFKITNSSTCPFTQLWVTQARLEEGNRVAYYIKNDLVLNMYIPAMNGNDTKTWSLYNEHEAVNSSSFKTEDISRGAKYPMEFDNEEIHVHFNNDGDNQIRLDFPLSSNQVYIIKQNYLYKIKDEGTSPSSRYGRQFTTSSHHWFGSESMMVHSTGISNTSYKFEPIAVQRGSTGDSAVVTFHSTLLHRVIAYQFSYSGVSKSMEEPALDSSSQYRVELNQLGASNITAVNVQIKTRSIHPLQINTFETTFTIVRCLPAFDSITSGRAQCTNDNFAGSVCSFTCDDNYGLEGANQLTCGGNGRWIGELPKCERIRCLPERTPFVNGTMSCTDSNFLGSTCSYICREDFGFLNLSLSTTSCSSKGDGSYVGAWSNTALPTCHEITCLPMMETPDNGAMTCSKDHKVSSFCNFTCNPTYGFINPYFTTSICQHDGDRNAFGRWSLSSSPVCKKIACPGIVPPRNGFVKCSEQNQIGSICEFSCGADYNLSAGSTTSSCISDGGLGVVGKWSSKPSCKIKTCPVEKEAPENGSMSCTDYENVGSICQYSCESGFVMAEANLSHSRCINDGGNSGKWNITKTPQCKLGTCTRKCHENGKCILLDDAWTCECKGGFIGDGLCCSSPISQEEICSKSNCTFMDNCELQEEDRETAYFQCKPCQPRASPCSNKRHNCKYCQSEKECLPNARCVPNSRLNSVACECDKNFVLLGGACRLSPAKSSCGNTCLVGIVVGLASTIFLLGVAGYLIGQRSSCRFKLNKPPHHEPVPLDWIDPQAV